MPTVVSILFGLAIGCFFGVAIGWLLASKKRTGVPADDRVENELRQQVAQRDNEQKALQSQLQALMQRNGELTADLKSLNERLLSERQQLEAIQEKFRKEFEAVSTKLIADNTSNFNRQSSENLDTLLKPFKDKLSDLKASLDKAHDATAANSLLLRDQVTRIGAEAANLSKALKGDVKVLGNWGENMLDQILEKSGLKKELHYIRQGSLKDADGDQRFLDVIVKLPEGRNLIIDSKVSLRAYEEYVNATDDAVKVNALGRHVDSLRKHFKELGAKRYHVLHDINAPDFVLMYVPIEVAFFAAIDREPELFAEALDHNVVLITNSTLLATLRTVSHVWQLANRQKNVMAIADLGGSLYDKFVSFVEDLDGIGKSLTNARSTWDEAYKKLYTGRGNLVTQTEKLKKLGANAAKSLPAPLVEKASEESESAATLRLPPA